MLWLALVLHLRVDQAACDPVPPSDAGPASPDGGVREEGLHLVVAPPVDLPRDVLEEGPAR